VAEETSVEPVIGVNFTIYILGKWQKKQVLSQLLELSREGELMNF
jgi:hypothetical protein